MEANRTIQKVTTGKKPGPTGTCRLCLQMRVLKDSHLIPRYLYTGLRTPDRKNPHPVRLDPNFEGTSSRQIKDYLLCGACEDLFNKNGETWMSQNGFRAPGEFKLQQAMKRTVPLLVIPEAKILPGDLALTPDALAKLTYFATSVFWRAAAQPWKISGHLQVRVELGEYEQNLRLYLLGKAQFPKNVAMWCHVSPAERPMGGLVAPYRKHKSTHHQFHFAIPGVAFDLFVGQTIPEGIYQLCMHRSVEHVVFLSDVVDSGFVSLVRSMRLGKKSK